MKYLLCTARLLVCLSLLSEMGLAQTPQPSSATWQETIEWLVPTFNQNARVAWTTTCGGSSPFERAYSESSSIQKYSSSASGVTDLNLRVEVSNGDHGFVNDYRIALAALNPDVGVDKTNLQSGGACSNDRSAKYVVFIAATALEQGITALGDNVYERNPRYIEIGFSDESMARRCASALSHLIVLAGGKTPKPPPF